MTDQDPRGLGLSIFCTIFNHCFRFLAILFRNLSKCYKDYVARKEEERANLQAFYADIKTQRGKFPGSSPTPFRDLLKIR
jgi:hypothetical protein